MKNYKKKDGYGYEIYQYHDDIIKNYLINLFHHGYFISRDKLNTCFWFKGYCNMDMEYSHWMLSYEKFRFKYYL